MNITKKQFSTLSELYDYYNESLFRNELPQCVLYFARHRGAAGMFYPKRWTGDNSIIHEIVINPDCMHISDMEWHQTLVHEMCHLWQEAFGKRSRGGYHNKEWGDKMEAVGLMPSSTGKEGGKKTGQRVADYAIDGGMFKIAFEQINLRSLENLVLPFMPIPIGFRKSEGEEGEDREKQEETKSGVKKKYTCACGNNVWGKSAMNIKCGDCGECFEEEQKE